jgi:hypothetical protein
VPLDRNAAFVSARLRWDSLYDSSPRPKIATLGDSHDTARVRVFDLKQLRVGVRCRCEGVAGKEVFILYRAVIKL